MKKVILFILLLPLVVFAQSNWHPVPNNQISYYKYGNYYFHVYTMKTDSVITIDTGQFFFNVKNPEWVAGFEEFAYYDPYSSWMGKEVFVSDAIARFYDNSGAEYTINFARKNNEPWRLYTEEDGSYIEAKVASLDAIPILEGLSDSVKYITFDFFSKQGIRINKSFYNDTLVLSKNYGLVNTPRFNNFSFNESFNELIGVEINGESYGWEYHFNEYVANYQIGDEIHVTNSDEDYIEVIIGKEQNDDFIDYEIQQCRDNGDIEFFIRRFCMDIYPGQSVLVPEGSGRHGRHKVYYLPTTWQGFPQHIFQFYYKYSDAEYEGQYVWRKEIDGGSTGIYPPLMASNEKNVSVFERGADEQWYIQYFHDDSYSFGIPYPFNCVVNVVDSEIQKIAVSPNPNRGVFKLNNTSGKKIEELRLLNAQGKIMMELNSVNQGSIDIQSQTGGLYILYIVFENASIQQEKIMIEK